MSYRVSDFLRFSARLHVIHVQRCSHALYVRLTRRHVMFDFGAPVHAHLRSFIARIVGQAIEFM